jgi:phospholipid/cholesterol/gamma-HCH transport system permease protein
MPEAVLSQAGDYHLDQIGRELLTVHLRGRMAADTISAVLKRLQGDLSARQFKRLVADLEQVDYFDDFGALALVKMREIAFRRGGEFSLVDSRGIAATVLDIVSFDTLASRGSAPVLKSSGNVIERLGALTLDQVAHWRSFITFFGAVIAAFMRIARGPRAFRLGDTIACMEKTGVNAVPIVGMLSFLLGLVIAFMSSLQLEQYGGNIYVAWLVAIAMVSELGPIMTAIIVAGRTGSAFAAEIGTMKISEEIDALSIMGFNPTIFLAVPRIAASLIVVPVLTLFADLFGIAGGLIIAVLVLDFTVNAYVTETLKALNLFEVCWGLSKSYVFALIVAWVGCLRGFQTRGGADAVGNAATSAVVTSVFLIILVDSIFAVARSLW